MVLIAQSRGNFAESWEVSCRERRRCGVGMEVVSNGNVHAHHLGVGPLDRLIDIPEPFVDVG